MKKRKRQTATAKDLLAHAIKVCYYAPSASIKEIEAAIVAYGDQRAADAIKDEYTKGFNAALYNDTSSDHG